jgi:hypothetical protein
MIRDCKMTRRDILNGKNFVHCMETMLHLPDMENNFKFVIVLTKHKTQKPAIK